MKHKNLITQDTITIELNDEQRNRIQYILKKYKPLSIKPKENLSLVTNIKKKKIYTTK